MRDVRSFVPLLVAAAATACSPAPSDSADRSAVAATSSALSADDTPPIPAEWSNPADVRVCWSDAVDPSDARAAQFHEWVAATLREQLADRPGLGLNVHGFVPCDGRPAAIAVEIHVPAATGLIEGTPPSAARYVVDLSSDTLNNPARLRVQAAALEAFLQHMVPGLSRDVAVVRDERGLAALTETAVRALDARYVARPDERARFYDAPDATGTPTALGIGELDAGYFRLLLAQRPDDLLPYPQPVRSVAIPEGLGVRRCRGAVCTWSTAPRATLTDLLVADDRVRIAPIVTAYTGPYFTGAPLAMPEGEYDETAGAIDWRRVRSLRVPAGTAVRLCTAHGVCRVLTASAPVLDGRSIASGATLAAATTFCEPQFAGGGRSFLPGDYALDASFGSMRVPPGLQVTMCNTARPAPEVVASAFGDCRRVTGDLGGIASLGDSLRGGVKWMRVEPATAAASRFTPTQVMDERCPSGTHRYSGSDARDGCLTPFQSDTRNRWVASLLDDATGTCVFEWASADGRPANLPLLANAPVDVVRPFCDDDVVCQGGVCTLPALPFLEVAEPPGSGGKDPCDVCILSLKNHALHAVLDPSFVAQHPSIIVTGGGRAMSIDTGGRAAFTVPGAVLSGDPSGFDISY